MKSKVFKSVFALTIMLLATVIAFSACSKDSDPRDQFIGIYRTEWSAVYGGMEYTDTYTLKIFKSSTNPNDIIMDNIDNSNESVRATVSGNAFTIPQQTILDMGISGSGTLNNNVLTFSTLETETGGTQVNLRQVATKQ